jgi:hypothetical protein
MALVQNPSALTWGVAKSRIARAAGVQDDDDWKLVAADALTTALHLLEIKRNWAWLFTKSDITLVDNTSTYAVGATFRKPYVAYTDDRRLIYVPERYYRDANPGNTAEALYWYSLYNTPGTGNVEFFGPLGTGYTGLGKKVHLQFIRAITIPTNAALSTADDAQLVDVPAQYEAVVTSWAKSIICLDKGGKMDEAAGFKQLGDELYNGAVRDEVDIPDADISFIPEAVRGGGMNPNSMTVLLGDVDAAMN